MASSRQLRQVPVGSSWRLVEGGDNDSFDTSIVPYDCGDDAILSGHDGNGPSQLSQLSHLSTRTLSSDGSQEGNIKNFLSKAERDEQVIMRALFRPSIPQSVRENLRETMKRCSPDSEFYLPRLDMDNTELRRRRAPSSPQRKFARADRRNQVDGRRLQSLSERLFLSMPSALYDILAWAFELLCLFFRYALKPLAILIAIYLISGGLIIVHNMATKSILPSLSPLCRIPGTSWLDPPFCPQANSPKRPESVAVDFSDLMGVQEWLEGVLERSAQGVSLPIEMKLTGASIGGLRPKIRASDVQGKEELLFELDKLVNKTRGGSNHLQKFNTHVGLAVDRVISINRWTVRYLDTLQAEHERARSKEWLVCRAKDLLRWLFAPFQPTMPPWDPELFERVLLDKYVEHTANVSAEMTLMIAEAQDVLRTLSLAEYQLGQVHDLVERTQHSVRSRRDKVLWTLWTLVRANTKSLSGLSGQLELLKRLDAQRSDAVRQVGELILELEKIQAGLADLRDRVAEPGLVRHQGPRRQVPISVHIETIDRGIERLEAARIRIRAMENQQIRGALARGEKAGQYGLLDATAKVER